MNKLKKIFKRITKKTETESGIVIMTVLWVLIILTVLAVSIGRQSRLEISLVRYEIGKIKSRYLAWAGLVYAMDQIKQDSGNSESGQKDILSYNGIAIDDSISLEEKFAGIQLDNGSFDISYEQISENENSKMNFGFRDEERFININAINKSNMRVLTELLVFLDVDSTLADSIASSVIDWTDADNLPTNDEQGAEDEYYLSLDVPYKCKNRPFDSMQELMLLKGMTKDIFEKVKNHITIFPKEESFKVNLDTASQTVLSSLVRSVSGSATNTTVDDADGLVAKMIDYRNGNDQIEATTDDVQIDLNSMALNNKEKVLFLAINKYRTKKSEYFRIRSKGEENTRDIVSTIQAVVKRSDLNILSFNRI